MVTKSIMMRSVRLTYHWIVLFSTFSLNAQQTAMFGLSEEAEVFTIKMDYRADVQREYVVQGSKYLNDKFQWGKWIKKNQGTLEVLLRYDAYNDIIQLIYQGEQGQLMQSFDIEAEIDGRRYQYRNFLDHDNLKSGYLTPLSEGKTILYSRTFKKILPPRMPENGYEFVQPAKFETRTVHYIEREGKTAMPLQDLSRKEVFAVLWDKYAELRKYARKNRLRVRTEEEAIAILAYYDSLKKNIEAIK